MKKCLCLSLLVALCAPAAAEWSEVGVADSSSQYIDASTLRKSGTTAKMWSLIDLKEPRETAPGQTYRSMKLMDEFDCSAERVRGLTFSAHSEAMGQGRVVYSSDEVGEWRPVAPKSINHAKYQVACGSGAASS